MSPAKTTAVHETILNVDDNEAARYAKTRVLLQAGYEVIEAATGKQALQLVREKQPDLVLLDVKLPDVDGYEVCRRIRSDPSSATMAVLQTSASFVDINAHVRALEGGADSYLIAPFEPEVLVASVRALLRMRRAESELVETREAFRATFEQAPVGIAHVAADGSWLRANRALLRMLALAEPPAGRLVDSLSGTSREVERRLAQLFDGSIEGFTTEQHVEDAEGRWHHVSLTASLVTVPAGPRYAILLLEEIGERKRIEAERRLAEEQRDQLLASERVARLEAEHASQVKDLFLATLSHELRTPLNAILGWAQILRSGPRDPAAVDEALDVIERNARAQSVLISDLLDISRIVAGKVRLEKGAVSLADVVSAAVEASRPDAEAKGIRLEKRATELGAPVFGDAARLQQVVWNLVSNAVKFTPAGGEVEVQLARQGRFARIAVRDTGQGIAPDFLPHLFQRFRQGDPSLARRHGGLGLGLSIVRSLVELHGGRVRVHSAGEGRGSTFVVELPLGTNGDLEERFSEAATDDVRADALVGVRVLLVDDDYDAREFVRRMLVQQGAEVCSVGSAREALESAPRFNPDILVSDIGMPEMDGYELLRSFREGPGPAVPAVALTSYAREEDYQRTLLAGYARHLPKPVQEHELRSALASLVASG